MGTYLPSAISEDTSTHSSPSKAYSLTVTVSSVICSPRATYAPRILNSLPTPVALAYSPSNTILLGSTTLNFAFAMPCLPLVADTLTKYSPRAVTVT